MLFFFLKRKFANAFPPTLNKPSTEALQLLENRRARQLYGDRLQEVGRRARQRPSQLAVPAKDSALPATAEDPTPDQPRDQALQEALRVLERVHQPENGGAVQGRRPAQDVHLAVDAGPDDRHLHRV